MNVHADPPPTYEIDPEYAGSELSYVDMQVLSHMFREWALNEPNTSPEWATRLMLWSCDYERLAEWFGVAWKPTNPSTRKPLDKFLAEQQLRALLEDFGETDRASALCPFCGANGGNGSSQAAPSESGVLGFDRLSRAGDCLCKLHRKQLMLHP